MIDPKSEEYPTHETKIVVDTDWKEQVAREKSAALQASSDLVDKEVTNTTVADSDMERDEEDRRDAPPPPASFETLVTMFFTQSLAMLGQIPNPATGKAEVNKPYAKHFIDLLDLLGEKSKGNLTPEEGKLLSEALHVMRMTYVNVKS
jgi:hypothetical protein